MRILLLLSLTYLVSCSTPQGPKEEDTRLVWGQEDKSIEDIFGNISNDDKYHNQHGHNHGAFWPNNNRGRVPASNSDCGNNKNSNYRNLTSLHGVNHNGLTNQVNTYEVIGKHETLMLVAYKIYGDYSLWRSIADLNPDVLRGSYDLYPGMLLKYYVPQEGYSFIPEGNPFLVRKGHSLSLISDSVYRDWRRWKEIYAHNQPFIKNPNLIYEGSTLFYVPDSQITQRTRVKLPKRSKRYSKSKYKNKSGRSVASINGKGSSSKGKSKMRKIRGLSSSQVVKEEIIPVRKAQYSKSSITRINSIKKAIENTHGDTEINGASKFDKYVEDNFID